MAYIPCKIGGGTEKATLLWTNPNPNQSLSTQTTVNANKSDYPFLIVEYKSSYSATEENHKMSTCIDRISSDYIGGYSIVINNFARGIIIADDKIIFAGTAYQINSSPVLSNAGYCIPLRVYGCKKIPYKF